MSNIGKCVESYFDSNKYAQEEIRQNLYKEAKNYPNKNFEINIELNQWGVYVAKLVFYDKKTFTSEALSKIKFSRAKKNKISKREKYSSKTYGEYKQTGDYKPCIY